MTAEELHEYMDRNNWSYRVLADTVGVQYSTVRRYRNGSLPIPRSFDKAMKLATRVVPREARRKRKPPSPTEKVLGHEPRQKGEGVFREPDRPRRYKDPVHGWVEL